VVVLNRDHVVVLDRGRMLRGGASRGYMRGLGRDHAAVLDRGYMRLLAEDI
jgi:hypothetical protein